MYLEVGKKYGLLTVLEDLGRTKHYEHKLKCVCDCGNVVERLDSSIQKSIVLGYCPSCGCNRKKLKFPE